MNLNSIKENFIQQQCGTIVIKLNYSFFVVYKADKRSHILFVFVHFSYIRIKKSLKLMSTYVGKKNIIQNCCSRFLKKMKSIF